MYYNTDYFDESNPTQEYVYTTDYTDYAKPRSTGGGEPEIDPENRVMTNFVGESLVTHGIVDNFNPGDIDKVTIVIWIEGNDPECTDDKLGGEFKVDMTFAIIKQYT